MDIVRRIVTEELAGALSLTTTAGEGTTFTMRVPQSLSITDALLFECATQRFAVPVRTVDEIVDLADTRVVVTPNGPGRSQTETMRLIETRGVVMPMVSLGARLALEGTGEAERALVVRTDDAPFAFDLGRLGAEREAHAQ
jgi:two-component system chemotaxis sensor kinase CheA